MDTPQSNQEPQNKEQMTKRELRAERREERHAGERIRERSRLTGRIITWVSVLVGIALMVGGIVWLAMITGPKIPTGPVPGVNEVVAADHLFGKADSNVTLIEYGDFQCPACGAYHPVVKQVADAYKDKIRIIFRNFPLSQAHVNAIIGAHAAEAAGKQNKYWEMHDKLYENQKEWSEGSASTARSDIEGYAKALGLNFDQFKQDIDSDEIAAKVDTDYASGVKSGVNSTPTFFLNGSKISPQSYDDFKRSIDKELGQ
jgi:protein-disulfide isomerase